MTNGCEKCGPGDHADLEIDVAFQPIFDLRDDTVFAYEALVRGPAGEEAASILSQVSDGGQAWFEKKVLATAIEKSVGLGLLETGAALSVNCTPNAQYDPRQCLASTIAVAAKVGLPHERLIFECTETVQIDIARARGQARTFKELGFRSALDDFGAGYHGLLVLADVETDIVKLDMGLIRGIHRSPVRRRIVAGTVALLRDLGRLIVAEGIECAGELAAVRKLGITLVQGHYLGHPSRTALQRAPYALVRAA